MLKLIGTKTFRNLRSKILFIKPMNTVDKLEGNGARIFTLDFELMGVDLYTKRCIIFTIYHRTSKAKFFSVKLFFIYQFKYVLWDRSFENP